MFCHETKRAKHLKRGRSFCCVHGFKVESESVTVDRCVQAVVMGEISGRDVEGNVEFI